MCHYTMHCIIVEFIEPIDYEWIHIRGSIEQIGIRGPYETPGGRTP